VWWGGNGVATPIFVALHPWLPNQNDSLLFYSKSFRCDYDHNSTGGFGNARI